MRNRSTLIGPLGLLSALVAVPAHAATVAYWNFEEGTNGANVAHSTGDGVYDGTVTDVSGNGNNLSAFTNGGYAGYRYINVVPYATTPRTGAVNKVAVVNTGAYPALNSSPTGTSSATGLDLRTIQPAQFTLEASYKTENNNSYRTIIGRDGIGGSSTGDDGNLSPLYFQLTPGNNFQVAYLDAAGVRHTAISTTTYTDGYAYPNNTDGVFHNYAATMDGTNLTLYVDGVQVGQTLVAGTTTDASLSNGSRGASDSTAQGYGDPWTAGEFTVGRGLYNSGHSDRAYGLIDDVRISNTALSPTQFLSSSAVPEPASLAVFGLAAFATAGRRRRA